MTTLPQPSAPRCLELALLSHHTSQAITSSTCVTGISACGKSDILGLRGGTERPHAAPIGQQPRPRPQRQATQQRRALAEQGQR